MKPLEKAIATGWNSAEREKRRRRNWPGPNSHGELGHRHRKDLGSSACERAERRSSTAARQPRRPESSKTKAREEDAEIERPKGRVDKATSPAKLALKGSPGQRSRRNAMTSERSLRSRHCREKLLETSLKEKYEIQIRPRRRDRTPEGHEGEVLDQDGRRGPRRQHCEIEFNKIRAAVFPIPFGRTTTPAPAPGRLHLSARPTRRNRSSPRSCSR